MFDQLHRLFQSFFDLVTPVWTVNLHFMLVNVLEIVVLLFFAFKVYKYIAGTHAEQLLKGIMVLIFGLILSKMFNLVIISTVLENLVHLVVFSLVVIFQPELRRLLVYLGQKGFINKQILNEGEYDATHVVDNIVNAVKHLSKSHTGALIVFQSSKGSERTTEVGIKLNANISTELILTIFHPNTPLHDGAVVIYGDKVLASGVLLPLTEDPKLSWQYGTRHRAAIGMSEVSDATCLVVSEETGNISMARAGKLINISDLAELKSQLALIYGVAAHAREKSDEDARETNQFRYDNFFPADLLDKKPENK